MHFLRSLNLKALGYKVLLPPVLLVLHAQPSRQPLLLHRLYQPGPHLQDSLLYLQILHMLRLGRPVLAEVHCWGLASLRVALPLPLLFVGLVEILPHRYQAAAIETVLLEEGDYYSERPVLGWHLEVVNFAAAVAAVAPVIQPLGQPLGGGRQPLVFGAVHQMPLYVSLPA